MKSFVTIGDLHCGSLVGLTPPGWQVNRAAKHTAGAIQKMLWAEFVKMAKPLRGMDYLLINGDGPDGDGKKSGGTEQLTTDRHEQGCMVVEVVKWLKPKRVLMSYGTSYHTGNAEDFELVISNKITSELGIPSEIDGHGFCEIEGVIFDYKHKVGASGIPHGRATALLREQLWSDLWAVHDEAERADVLIRSHVHYHMYAGNNDFLAMTLPPLQGPGSKYGVRQCSGIVDFGFCSFQVDKGEYTWQSHIKGVTDRSQKIKRLK